MDDMISLCARRFDALHQLLTGEAHPELRAHYRGTDHPKQDAELFSALILCVQTVTETKTRKRSP